MEGTIHITLYYRNGCLRYLRAINFHIYWLHYLYNRLYDIKSRYMEEDLVDPAGKFVRVA
jgi:hypothetical protein